MQRMIRSVEITDIDLVREALVKAMLVLRMMPLSYQDRPSPCGHNGRNSIVGRNRWVGSCAALYVQKQHLKRSQ